jgi:hypothetical protein
MISFAAMLSIQLSTMGTGTNLSLAPSIRILIKETADVLERIGANPPHRKGISALYGRHLREVMNNSSRWNNCQPRSSNNPVVVDEFRQQAQQQAQQQPPAFSVTQPPPSSQNPAVYHQNQSSSSDPADMEIAQLVRFSAMSDDEIIRAINNAGDELGTFMPTMQIDERTGLDWLDWFNMEANS